MNPASAIILTIIAITIILLFASFYNRKEKWDPRENFFAGELNVGLYDYPYINYPIYSGYYSLCNDESARCVAFCENEPCTIWCR